jgi:hypothetical protein
MPLQTSRYLMAFASVILCICGLTLVDQLPGISLNLRKAEPVRRAPERTAHTLQPLPPAEPQWDPAMVDPVVMDYPDMYQAQQQQVPTFTASYQAPAEPVENTDWNPEPNVDWNPEPNVDWNPEPVAAPVEQPVPQEWTREPQEAAIVTETFDASDFSDFGESMLEVPAVEPPTAMVPPVLPPRDADPAIVTELESTDGVLGVGSSEPFEVEEQPASTAVSLMEVPQEPAAPTVPTLPALPASPEKQQIVGDVMVLGFIDAEKSTSGSAEPPVSRVVEGSYRIRKLVRQPQMPSRIQRTFRFDNPPVETAPVRPKTPESAHAPAPARPVRRCQHHLRTGQKVCPHCGVIRN